MNILKHMEAVFIAAALVAVPVATVGVPAAPAPDGAAASAAIASGDRMAVVTVTAKRPATAGKAPRDGERLAMQGAGARL